MSSNNSENSENCCLDVVSPPPDPLMYPNHPSNSSNDLEKRTAPLVPSRPKYLQPKLNLRRSFGKQNDSSDLPPIPPKRIMIPISRSDNPHSPENSSDDEQQYLRSLSSSSLPPNRKPPPIPTSKPFDISHTDHSYVESLSESESGSIVSFTNHGVHSNNSSCADLDMLNDDDMHIRRTNIANEILNSELNYINTLRVLIDVWMKPILEQNPNEPIVPHESIKYLFSNVEIILNINQQFYNDFEKQMNQWSSTQCVGMVFLTLIPFFKVYMQYINNYNKSMEIYQDLLKKKVFKKYIEDCIRTGTQYDNLTSYLITPIQRIPRYQLLISELHKYTPQNHPDYKNIELALEKIKAMAEEINSHKRDAENLNQCAIIQNQLIFSDDMKKNHKKLVTPTRRYVSKGRLTC